jgi:hypothetical protein
VGQPNYLTAFGFTTGLPQNPPACGFPVIAITGFSSLGQSGPISGNNFNTYEGADSVSYTRGKHLFKFGGELRHSSWTGASYTAIRGTLSFGSVNAFVPFSLAGSPTATALEDFLLGAPASGTALLGDPLRNVSVNAYSAFIQDDWRVTSRITANLGLRYEYEPPITAASNLIGNFNPSAPEGLDQQYKRLQRRQEQFCSTCRPGLGRNRQGHHGRPRGCGSSVHHHRLAQSAFLSSRRHALDHTDWFYIRAAQWHKGRRSG